MVDKYFVISSSEDGVYFEQIDEQELLNRFNAQGDDRYYGDKVPTPPSSGFVNLWEKSQFFIIKGDFVSLQPKQVVQEWEIA